MRQSCLSCIVVKNNQGTTLSGHPPAAGRTRRLTDAGEGAIAALAARAADLNVVLWKGEGLSLWIERFALVAESPCYRASEGLNCRISDELLNGGAGGLSGA